MKLKVIFALLFLSLNAFAANAWEARLDGKISFYQTTDFGVLVVGTEKSLYAVDGANGEIVWRRKDSGLNETSVTPVPSTDLILISQENGSKSRVSAVDLLSGETLWTSDKVKGKILQLAVEPEQNLLCVVLVKNPNGKIGENLKREPVIHVFDLKNGDEIWKKDLGGKIEMMPANFTDEGDAAFTLDNYRAPLILDDRLFLFYEGATSFNVRDGKERERERFKINEENLALTEADPIFDDEIVFTSGRGRVRAVSRRSGEEVWTAKDLGVTPEMALIGEVLYVRTGGQFTNIKTGETENKGSYGVSALNRKTGKVIWRYKGADKGLTNLVFSDATTILLADKDDLIILDAVNGKRINNFGHRIKDAQFVLINERGEAIVGGREQISGFRVEDLKRQKGKLAPVWTAKHDAPERGILSKIGSIGLRATALYFRYGGLVNFGFNAFRGAQIANSVAGLRWSGLKSGVSNVNLTTLATSATKSYVSNRIKTFGIAARTNFNSASSIGGLTRPRFPDSGDLARRSASQINASRGDVQEKLLDRLDPVQQIDKLASYLERRKRLAALRGNFFYFYTDLPKPFGGKGLIGVNVQNGVDSRFAKLNEPDSRFITDEISGLLYSANGNRLNAYGLSDRR